MLFHCPFPGHKHGDRKPSLTVTNGDTNRPPFWKCWTCGKQGNAIRWVMEFRDVGYEDALRILKIDHPNQPPLKQELPIHPDNPPAEKWQARAWKLIERAEETLWSESGKDTLTWLRARGLNDASICAARMGFLPKDFADNPKVWGTPNDDPRPLYFVQGILIPGVIGSAVWYLKMRPSRPFDGQKYKHVRGGKQALYRADTLTNGRPAVFCEGELDANLLAQETRDLADVVTLASATSELNVTTWGLYLLRSSRFIVAYDMDEAGWKGAAKLTWLHHSQRLNIPALRAGDKDISDYYRSGGNLHDLIEGVLSEDARVLPSAIP